MPLGNPIRKQNESRMVSVLATEGQTVFTVQDGYIINQISVFRNGVRLSPAEDFTAGDGSTVTLNNAANIDDRIDFHIFDRFTVQNAIIGAASTQTINGDLVLNGKLFGALDVPSINLTGIITATELDLNGKGDISGDLNVVGVTTVGKQIHVGTGVSIAAGGLNVTAGISTFQAVQGTTGTFSAAVSGTTGTFSGDITANGNIAGDNSTNITGIAGVTATTLTGTLQTAAQANVTSVGTLSGLTVSGDVSIADKIVHTADENTTIRFPAADTVSIETAGSERVRIASGGAIIKGNSGTQVSVGNGANTQLVGSAGADASLALIRQAAGGGELYFAAGTSGTNISSGNGLGFIKFMGYHTDGYDEYARIEAYADGTTGNSDAPGRIVFKTTADGANSGTERLRLNSEGAVHINDGSATAARFSIGNGGDLKLFHTNPASYIQDGSSALVISSARIDLSSSAGENMARFYQDGAVELYNNGTKTFETLSSGNRSNITGSNTFIVGSSNAGGAYLVLDGDSNGDGSGGDYAYLEHSTDGHLNLVATNPADDAVMHFYTGSGSRRMTLSSARDLLSIGTTSDECPAWSTDRAGIKMASNQPVLYMVDNQDTSGDDGYLGRAGGTTYLGSKGGSVILQTSASGSGTTARFTIDTVGAVTHASANTGAHTQFYSYAGSVNGETTFRIGNTNAGSSANIRLLLSTYANQGADPYIKFDSGGTNFVVGQRWAGTTSNALVLGKGEDPSSMDAQVFMDGTGDVKFGSNGASVSGSSGFYINCSGNAGSSVDNGYVDHRRRVGSGNAVAVHRGTQGQLQIHGDGDCENTNNNYTGISDVSLKENIVDASSQWNDIKAVKVRKFNFKSETGYSTDTHIGVVAQELESVSPNLVKETRKDPDPKATDTSTIKSVKYSILYMKSVKALQEAMARIETLETKVAALEGS